MESERQFGTCAQPVQLRFAAAAVSDDCRGRNQNRWWPIVDVNTNRDQTTVGRIDDTETKQNSALTIDSLGPDRCCRTTLNRVRVPAGKFFFRIFLQLKPPWMFSENGFAEANVRLATNRWLVALPFFAAERSRGKDGRDC